jgi:ankyrin repeat protein
VDFCRLLLENGADANILRGGALILVESASQGNLEVVKLLVEKGAAVDAVDSEGCTALQKASVRGHISVATYLLDHGADINHADQTGLTSIFLAVDSRFAKLVQLLIDRGADLHRATTDGRAPIHISWDDAETTRVLMENGADPNQVVNGVFPLYLAASNNEIEVVKVLLSFNPDLEI